MLSQISTPKLVLRKPKVEDLDGYLAYRNDHNDLSSQMMDSIDEKNALKFLQTQSEIRDDAYGWRMFSIEKTQEAGIIGEVGVFISQNEPRQGDLGWWLHSNFREQGYAIQAASALIDYCFADRELHRVTAHCLSTNMGSRKLMLRLGMRFESETIESRYANSRWHNEVGYAMLRREWETRQPVHKS